MRSKQLIRAFGVYLLCEAAAGAVSIAAHAAGYARLSLATEYAAYAAGALVAGAAAYAVVRGRAEREENQC